ncbi:MAG: tagaturonate reductase [Oscillospiraceae bacterium]|nr:tagaturonate reductase [Oscillospiraceae bacterium]
MKTINQVAQNTSRPVSVLQFGEGNFLRAFADQMIDVANSNDVFNGNVHIVKSIPQGSLAILAEQDFLYTVILRGKKDGANHVEEQIVTSIDGATCAYEDYPHYAALAKSEDLRFIISNTTEAGIVFDESDEFDSEPPNSFPGKLTKFLYERFEFFDGAVDKGIIILPVELIEKNGETLLKCCKLFAEKWNLPETFMRWLTDKNIFCNTLVDRIVTGFPTDEAQTLEDELGYSDRLMVVGEPFALWVIETDNPTVSEEFPLNKAGLPVIFTENLKPYRERKVRLLNGAHTATVAAAFLSGLDTVGDMMNDKVIRGFLEEVVYNELAPFVPLPEKDVLSFADSVLERFENPFIRHYLLSITLNSVSKFKARILPTILETYADSGSLPKLLCFSLAALIAFYRGRKINGKLMGTRNGMDYEIADDAAVLEFFNEFQDSKEPEIVTAFLGRIDFWGEDLTLIDGFCGTVIRSLQSISADGMRDAIEKTKRSAQ